MIFSFRMFPFKENLAISLLLVALGGLVGIGSFLWLETVPGTIFCCVIYIAGLWDFFVMTEFRFYGDKVEKKSVFTSRFKLSEYKRLEIYPNGIYFLKGKNTYINRLRGIFIPVRNWNDIALDRFDAFLSAIEGRLEIVRLAPAAEGREHG